MTGWRWRPVLDASFLYKKQSKNSPKACFWQAACKCQTIKGMWPNMVGVMVYYKMYTICDEPVCAM